MQFHVLSFEGPDPYAFVGGLATRIEGLTETLAELGFETHLWFIGDPERPGEEKSGLLRLHRWAQWMSRHHPGGVYDGELDKVAEYARTLPPNLMRKHLRPHLRDGGRAVILAEEWQTVDAVIRLDWLLRDAGVRDQVSILWNAKQHLRIRADPVGPPQRGRGRHHREPVHEAPDAQRELERPGDPERTRRGRLRQARQAGRAGASAPLPGSHAGRQDARWDPDSAGIGSEVEVEITVEYERHRVRATIAETPFFNPARKRA